MTQKIPQGGVIVTARLNNNHLGGFLFPCKKCNPSI